MRGGGHFARTVVLRHSALRTLVKSLVHTDELVFAFYFDYQVDGKLATGSVENTRYPGNFWYTNFESTSYWKVNPDVLKPNDAAVETAFVITVPFLSYFSAVLEWVSTSSAETPF